MATEIQHLNIDNTVPQLDRMRCKFCNSNDTIKYGRQGEYQCGFCKKCKRKFLDNGGFPKSKIPKNIIGAGISLYYGGVSTREVGNQLFNLFKYPVNKSTVWRWIMKYTPMANRYIQQYEPTVGDQWYVDETAVKIFGKQYWFWDVIDGRTRFLIATHLSKGRTLKDAVKLFKRCKNKTRVKPIAIFSDNLHAYHRAINKVFYSRYSYEQTLHMRSTRGISGVINTNMIERFHGTLKQRYKVMRSLKRTYSANIILDGFITHYNFFMPHSSLGNITPSASAGIEIDFINWEELISRAIKSKYRDKYKTNPAEVYFDYE